MIKRYGILNDIHFPYEDRTRYPLAIKILHELGIDHLYLNGDIGEFASVSAHPRHPSDPNSLLKEVEYINKKFDELQSLFSCPVTLIEGNHCYRFFRYIRDVAPQMWGLIDCPLLLKFDQRPGWKFVPYGPTQIVKCGVSNLYLRHEPLGGGKFHAKATAENSLVDLAFGHTHQYQIATHRKFGPKPSITKAYSLGWLGDRKWHTFDYRGAKDNWVEGFTIVEAEDSGEYSLEFIDLRKLPILYRGKRYK